MTFDLRRERMDRGHSQRSLARELQVGDQAIRRLEDGEAVHPATAKKVADYFGIKVTDLMPVERSAA